MTSDYRKAAAGSGLFEDAFARSRGETVARYSGRVVYYDGRFVQADSASVSVWDHAFLYGDAAIEGIRAYSCGVFKLYEHIDRLLDTCRLMSIDAPLSSGQLAQVVVEVLRRSRLADAHIRPFITRGIGEPGLDPRRAVGPSVIVMAYPLSPTFGKDGLSVLVSSIRRKSPHSVDSRIKSSSYLDSVLAKLQANAAGFDDALMLAGDGTIAEATTANVFIVQSSGFVTPPTVAALPGITRQVVLDIAAEAGWQTDIRPVTYGDLMVADEAFICGTGAEIAGVVRVDGRPIGLGEVGAVTRKVQERYREIVMTSHRTEYETSQ